MVAAPLPALAQTWSSQPAAETPTSVTANPAPSSLRLKTEPAPSLRPVENVESVDADETPDVDIKPKAEWSADDGLRMTPTRIAYKRRF